MNRRSFIKLVGAATAGAWSEQASGNPTQEEPPQATKTPIDRHALVTRHNVIVTQPDVLSPLTVGNGEFAFTADVTGLQTFETDYNRGIPLSTMAQWGFHAAPNPQGYALDTFPLTPVDTSGRSVGYLYYERGKSSQEWEAAANYLYANPGRLHLGRVALALTHANAKEATLADLREIHQELDLWTGQLHSRFTFDGKPVQVTTCCHPEREHLAVRIESPLMASGQLAVLLAFPYGSTAFNGNGADWNQPEAHHTVLTRTASQRADFARTLDNDRYHAALTWSRGSTLSETLPHHYLLSPAPSSSALEFTLAFAPSAPPANLPTLTQTRSASARMWKKFWSTGGVIDLSLSKDPRWKELERRIVLSQYLTRIQCAGSLPPPGDGADLQQLVWQVPPGNALVARRPFSALESRRTAEA